MKALEIRRWLRETDPRRLEELWHAADEARRLYVGEQVHLRALVEISSHCVRQCGYCGLRAERRDIERYRMPAEEILACAKQARQLGYGTIVLQAGEDPALTMEWVADLIRQIRQNDGDGPRNGDGLRFRRPENGAGPHFPDRADAGTNGDSKKKGDRHHSLKSENGASLLPASPRSPLAITLSLGERTEEDLRTWKLAGADRYLLRFETSNRELYEHIHPSRPGTVSDRVAILRTLRGLGYEVGSGVMIGIPGQSYEDLARDIELFAELDLDMIGVGPFIPHPDTPLGNGDWQNGDRGNGDWLRFRRSENGACPHYPPDRAGGGQNEEEAGDRHHSLESENGASPLPASSLSASPQFDQVPATEEMTYKVLALARLACPGANIPSTTALATLNRRDGRELGLMRGANIVMPNLTPVKYRRLYEIYPNKACVAETPIDCSTCLDGRIRAIGRTPGAGRGDSPRKMWHGRPAHE